MQGGLARTTRRALSRLVSTLSLTSALQELHVSQRINIRYILAMAILGVAQGFAKYNSIVLYNSGPMSPIRSDQSHVISHFTLSLENGHVSLRHRYC